MRNRLRALTTFWKIGTLFMLVCVLALVATAGENYNTGGRWVSTGSVTIPDGNGQSDEAVTAITLGSSGTITVTLGGAATTTVAGGAAVTSFTLPAGATFTLPNTLDLNGDTAVTVATGEEITINAAAQVGIDEVLALIVDQADDADATDVLQAIRIELASESGDANDEMRGIVMTVEEGTANTIIDAAILIDNEETTASTLTDAIIVTSSGVAAGVTDALDASAANIVNAINIGANLIAGTDDSLSVGATDDTVILDSNDSGGNYICTDADANANCAFAAGGTGVATLGAAANTSTTIVADGGVVTIDGTITSAATADLGWTLQTGANVACNTTCTSACVLGFELDAWDATSLLGCADATADSCLCAGGS